MKEYNSGVIVCRKREKKFLQIISRAFKPFSYRVGDNSMRQYSLKNMVSCGCADYYYSTHLLPSGDSLSESKAYVFGIVTEYDVEDSGDTCLFNVHHEVHPYLEGMCKAFRLEGGYLTIDGIRYYLNDESFINSSTLLGMFLLHVLKLNQTNQQVLKEISFVIADKFKDKGQLRASLILAPVEELCVATQFDSSSFELRNYYRYDFIFSARGLSVSSSGSRAKSLLLGTAQPCRVDFDGELVEWI